MTVFGSHFNRSFTRPVRNVLLSGKPDIRADRLERLKMNPEQTSALAFYGQGLPVRRPG
jgi:hypothetical protein